MLQQDLHSHTLVPGAGQVQWCPKIIDWVDINTPGQQQSYNLAMPWMHNETQQDTSGIQVMFSKPSLKVFFLQQPSLKVEEHTFVHRIVQWHGAPGVRHRRVTAMVEKVPRDALTPPRSSRVDWQPAYNERISLIAFWHFLESRSQLVATPDHVVWWS
jgi:hypothetical protein